MRAYGDAPRKAGSGGGVLQIVKRGIGLAALAVCMATSAWAQNTIDWFTIDGGGIMVASASGYTLGGTIGQPDAGILSGGAYSLSGGFWVTTTALVGVGDGDGENEIPRLFRLHAAIPNPLLDHSRIAFDLPQAQFVRIRLYNAAGRLTRNLAEEHFPAGRHYRVWDGTDDRGHPVAAGVYMLRFDAETDQGRQKVVVLR